MMNSSSSPIVLQIGNLPSNHLALTNKVYISPTTFKSLLTSTSATPQNIIITVGPHAYTAEAHNGTPIDQVALNGLQRRFAKHSLGTKVEVKRYEPIPGGCALCALELHVDLLSKRSSVTAAKGTSQGREIDTDRLVTDVKNNYIGQVVEVGQVLAMDFEGTKVELTVASLEFISSSFRKKQKEEKLGKDGIKIGQILEPTEIQFQKAKGTKLVSLTGSNQTFSSAGGGGSSSIFLGDFDFEKLGIGGLNSEFNQIFRRAFASRIWPSHIIKQMGILHVRGMLLYGPPGCGKTLIARQIGKVLNAREPKIVNGPEILNKYVGGSEEKVRELFAEAEKEQAEDGDASMLHIIILDEMDAICKSRGTNRDGTGVSDSVVNQLLSKIDGVDSLNNILLIGMTNRMDMIDDALLRPGRLELHVEIGLPNLIGRNQILSIHTKAMRESRRIESEALDKMGLLAEKTKNFSGAELAGLIRAATSYALTRCVDVENLSKGPDEHKLMLEYADFIRALGDIQPKFGAKSRGLKELYRNGFVNYGEGFDFLMGTFNRLVEQVRFSNRTPLMTVLLRGPPASGKTATVAKIAVSSGFPFVRMISADEMIGYSEVARCSLIHKVFMDAYKSPLSLIIIDDIERIIDYVPIGPRFSNSILQALLVLLKKTPPCPETDDDDQRSGNSSSEISGRKLFVIGTTSIPHLMEDLGLAQAFSVTQSINLLQERGEIIEILRETMDSGSSFKNVEEIAASITKPIGIKNLLMVLEMARQASSSKSGGDLVDVNIFRECMHTAGY